MKKSDLNKHLDLLRNNALEALRVDFHDKKEKAIRDYVDSLWIDSMINKAESLTRLLIVELRQIDYQVKLGNRHYGIVSIEELETLLLSLNSPADYVNGKKKTELLPEYISLENTEKLTRSKINTAYETLKQNVSTYKTAAEAIPYLESMGISVPEEEKIQVMLIKPVDPDSLKYIRR